LSVIFSIDCIGGMTSFIGVSLIDVIGNMLATDTGKATLTVSNTSLLTTKSSISSSIINFSLL